MVAYRTCSLAGRRYMVNENYMKVLKTCTHTVHVIDFVSLFCCSKAISKPYSPGNGTLMHIKDNVPMIIS